MRVSAAHKKSLSQRDQRKVCRCLLARLGDDSVREWFFQANSGGSSKYELPAIDPAEGVIARILGQNPGEISLRPEKTGSHASIHSVVRTAGRLQFVISMVANKAETRLAHTHWQRQ